MCHFKFDVSFPIFMWLRLRFSVIVRGCHASMCVRYYVIHAAAVFVDFIA